MDNRTEYPVEGQESSEARSSEQQDLENTTLDPRAKVEQTGDIRQAEEVQEAFTSVVENAKEQTREVGATPLPIPHEAHEVGATPLPIPYEAHEVGATPLPIPRPEDESLKGSLPEMREDLDQVTVKGKDTPGGDRATPIPLPGAGGLEATPIPLPAMRIQEGEEEEGHPPEPPDLDHSPFPEESLAAGESDSVRGQMPKVRDDLDQAVSSTGEPGGEEATPINLPGPQDLESNQTPETPRQEAEFEKPILHKEMENLDSGLEGLDDIESLIPTPGKIGGDFLDGFTGFEGGPSDLKNDPGSPHDEPPPGGFPSKGEMKGGGKKTGPNNDIPGYGPGSGYAFGKDLANMGEYDEGLTFESNWEAVPKNETIDPFEESVVPAQPADYKAHEKDKANFQQLKAEAFGEAVWKFFGVKNEPDEGSGKDPNKPIGQQMGGARMDPSTDKDQISNYPEDHIESNQQGGGMLSEENAEKLKRTLDNKAKREQTSPKVTNAQVTDPPEPAPGKSSENTGKSG